MLELMENYLKIFGYVIDYESENSFNECSKIYRSKGGSYEVMKFQAIPPEPAFHNSSFGGMNPNFMNYNTMMNKEMGINPGMGMMNMNMNMMNNNMAMNPGMGMMNMMNSAPMMNNHQMNINMNFQRNAITSIQSIMDKP